MKIDFDFMDNRGKASLNYNLINTLRMDGNVYFKWIESTSRKLSGLKVLKTYLSIFVLLCKLVVQITPNSLLNEIRVNYTGTQALHEYQRSKEPSLNDAEPEFRNSIDLYPKAALEEIKQVYPTSDQGKKTLSQRGQEVKEIQGEKSNQEREFSSTILKRILRKIFFDLVEENLRLCARIFERICTVLRSLAQRVKRGRKRRKKIEG